MKLLFDENLSPTLAQMLAGEYAGSAHVKTVGLLGADDQQVWGHARVHGFAIVSKDTDFRERSFVEGHPPKVIWLDVGNAGYHRDRESATARVQARRCLRETGRSVDAHPVDRRQRRVAAVGARYRPSRSRL